MSRTVKPLRNEALDVSASTKRVEPIIRTIQGHFDSGVAFKKMAHPRRMADAIESFTQATTLADDLMRNEAHYISPKDKDFLANVYAEHGQTLLEDHPFNREAAKEAVKKELALDPGNRTAFKLDLRLNIGSYITEEPPQHLV